MTEAFPLQWPDGWPRTPPTKLDDGWRFSMTPGQAQKSLYGELGRLGAKHIVVSTNQVRNRDGSVRVSARRPDDEGVAVYFEWQGRALVMACDRYHSLHHNMRSIALAIEALRQLERHGGGVMLERAFAGFEALPAPKGWAEVLGVSPTASHEEITAAYRARAKRLHSDVGGSDGAMAELNAARDEALRSLEA